jgi:hypothetical protein
MALRRVYKKQYQGVSMISGHFYKFKYKAFERDPKPLIILMHSIEGIHPNTGHQWRIFQAINFTYIPRAMRKRFLKVWLKEMEKPGNIKFHWQRVLTRYPYLKIGIRRYFFTPAYYITNLQKIPDDRIEKEVIKSLIKDFSKKVTTGIRGLISKAKKGREKKRKLKKKKQREKQRNR